jgi:F-type H+-transporting ATPase subunit b
MGDASLSVLAASQVIEGEKQIFLVPNGTFFFELAIFLIVLGIIGGFVVPPVMRVLRERDAMVHKTAADGKKAAEQFAAAQADYEEAMKKARVEASSLRDNARSEGRKVVDDARADAEREVMSTLQSASDQLKRERDGVELGLRANVSTMSETLASRILGVDVTASTTTG